MSAILALLLSFSALAHASTPHVIYGEDTRVDLYDVHDKAILDLADSTVAMIQQKDLEVNSDGTVSIALESYAEANRLCSTERFADQGAAADCSGFLISSTRVATAGHCIKNKKDCEKYAFAFNFAIKKKGDLTPSILPANQVYSCKNVVASRDFDDPDYAIVELDRPVPATDHKPLKLNASGAVTDGTKLFVIGYPVGLPAKYADKAQVRSQDERSFTSNLNTFNSNSGSPIFNAETRLVEGILTSGEVDFVDAPGLDCRISRVCAKDGCRGEAATKISVLKPYL
jgi:hypothetical protein